jgi:hypothetical protein
LPSTSVAVNDTSRPKESGHATPPRITIINSNDEELDALVVRNARASSTRRFYDDDIEQRSDVLVRTGYDHETEEEEEEEVEVVVVEVEEYEFAAHCEGRLVDDEESGVLVLDGEVTQEEKNQKMLIMVSFVVFAAISFIVLVVALSTLALNRNRPNPPMSGILQSTTTNNSKAAGKNYTPEEPLMIETFFPNQTIKDGFLMGASISDPVGSLAVIPIGKYVLDLVGRPDINMTVFGIGLEAYTTGLAKTPTLLVKFFQPTFSGHTVSS